MLNTIQVALSGLQAASNRLNASASNIANISTTGSLDGSTQAPYQALTTTQSAVSNGQSEGAGVRSEIVTANRPFVPAYDPDSPFADENGVIGVPNVNLTEEAVQLNLAKTSYKANIGTLKVAEELSDELLSIFDEEA